MWFDLFATLWGAPLSLLGDALIHEPPRWVVGLTVVLNGALWGSAIGLVFQIVSAAAFSRGRG
jgi:hypothetical protein